MEDFNKQIGSKLRAIRRSKKILARQLGKSLNLSEDMIYRIERSERPLNQKYRKNLQEILGIDIFEIDSNSEFLNSELQLLKKVLISYNLTLYELNYIKAFLQARYFNDTIQEEKVNKMYGSSKTKGNIDIVLKFCIDSFDMMLKEKDLYHITKNNLHGIINSLNASELINDYAIPIYNASTFFPYLDNVYKNIPIDYYLLPKNLANDKNTYIGISITNFILEVETPKYKPLDIIILKLDNKLNNGADILLSTKEGISIKSIIINNDVITLSNPSEINPNFKTYQLKDFMKMVNSHDVIIVGTVINIVDNNFFAYNYSTHKNNLILPFIDLENKSSSPNIEKK